MARISDLLMEARCRLMIKEPWYGHMAMGIEWKEDSFDWDTRGRKKTMAVCLRPGGKVQCLYYKPFVASLSLKQLYGVVQHEIEHLVRLHLVRIGSRDPLGWNLAADMCVNGTEANPRIGFRDERQHILPSEGLIFIPKDWPENESAEVYYAKMEKLVRETGGFKMDADGNITGLTEHDIKGQTLDNHLIWQRNEVSEDEARQIVKGMCDSATAKSAGQVPGHLTEILKELNQPIVHWRGMLRQYYGRHVGNKRFTFSRSNRRHQSFGIKGISRHACATVRIILDTSGSMSTRQLEIAFGEIEQISSHVSVKLLLWDHGFQGYKKYRRGDWKNFPVNGRGGTDMEAPVQWLEENREIGDIQIMITDGEVSGWPKPRAYPMIFLILNSVEKVMPGWGHEVFVRLGAA